MDQPPPSGRLFAIASLLYACQGFMVYAPGFITPFVERDLGVPRALSAAPTALMAIGLFAGGVVTPALRRRLGSLGAIRLAIAAMAFAALLLATPVTVVPVLAGAVLLGLSIGGMIVYVNSALGTGPRGGLLLTRVNLASMAGGLVAPLALAAAAGTVGWSWGLLLPIPLLLLVLVVIPPSPVADEPRSVGPGTTGARLPRAFWWCWAFLALSIAVEFSFVAWGSQVAELRAGIDIEAATGLAGLFTLGMLLGRVVVGFAPRLAARPVPVLRAATGVVIAGAIVLWAAGSPAVAGLGLLLGGIGTAPGYPLGATLAIAQAPRLPVQASSRLTAASAVSILAAPMALGIAASRAGVEAAWLLVVLILVAALGVAMGFPRATEPEVESSPA